MIKFNEARAANSKLVPVADKWVPHQVQWYNYY